MWSAQALQEKAIMSYTHMQARDLGCDDKGVQRTVGGNVPSRRTDGKSKRQNR